MTPLLQLENLGTERDDRVLFEGLNCEINAGEVVQVLGPNGSGKTTLLRIMLGLNPDYSGEVLFKGQSITRQALQFRQHLLYIGHLPAINRSLTPLENLRWFQQLQGTAGNLESALKAVGLRGFEDVPGQHLSAGQHRRVALARLHLSKALIWILDEPFTAIDVQGVDDLRRLFGEHSEKGGIIVLTTHQDLGIDGVRLLNLADYRPRPKLDVA